MIALFSEGILSQCIVYDLKSMNKDIHRLILMDVLFKVQGS